MKTNVETNQFQQPITEIEVTEGKDRLMIYEANRLRSFKEWPFMTGACTKEEMAAAGFYHSNIPGEVDGVRCFCCFKELDGFEETDDPWLEHKKHNNNDCCFIKFGKREAELTVAEFIKVVEEREVNLLNKVHEINKQRVARKLEDYGLNVLNI